MTVIFQSHHQFQFCDRILRSLEEDDGDSLLVATSSQEDSLASLKMIQIFSPLLRNIMEDLPLSSTPQTLIIPDTDAWSWKNLMCLLTNGNVDVSLSSGDSDVKCEKENISSLARCLGIHLETKQVLEEAHIKLRVRRPEELMEGFIFPLVSNQEANIVNNDYDSDHDEVNVPIKSETSDSDILPFSTVTLPINQEINDSEKLNVTNEERCNDSGIDTESCLGNEFFSNSPEGGPAIPPPPEKILLNEQESFGESGSREEFIDRKTFSDFLGEQNVAKQKSQKESVTCDESRSRSSPDGSRDGAVVSVIENNESWSCEHDTCRIKFNSVEERNCHMKVHQKFKKFSKISHPQANNQDNFGFWYQSDPSVPCDEARSVSDDSTSTAGSTGVQAPKVPREELRRRWQKKDATQGEQAAQELELEPKKKNIGKKRKHEDDGNNNSKAKSKRNHCSFICSRCTKTFKFEDSLFEHMNAAHLKIRKPYECSECVGDGRLGPAVYVSRKQLTDHLRRIHSMRIRKIRYNFKNGSAAFEYETFVAAYDSAIKTDTEPS